MFPASLFALPRRGIIIDQLAIILVWWPIAICIVLIWYSVVLAMRFVSLLIGGGTAVGRDHRRTRQEALQRAQSNARLDAISATLQEGWKK
jgi:hypothetical protein